MIGQAQNKTQRDFYLLMYKKFTVLWNLLVTLTYLFGFLFAQVWCLKWQSAILIRSTFWVTRKFLNYKEHGYWVLVSHSNNGNYDILWLFCHSYSNFLLVVVSTHWQAIDKFFVEYLYIQAKNKCFAVDFTFYTSKICFNMIHIPS